MKPFRFPRSLATALALMLLALLAGGIWFFRAQQEYLRQIAENELLAVAQLKVEQITDWRSDQLAEARELMDSQFLKLGVAAWMTRRDPDSRDMILARMRSLQAHYGYEDILLVNPAGEIILSLAGTRTELDQEAQAVLEQALASGEAWLTDLHFGGSDQVPHIGAVAPLFPDNAHGAEAVGAFILQSNPRQYLYPLIQTWPLPSQTGETLLVRRDGDDVLFLNDLRFQPGTALSLRIPLADTQVPAVMAALGESGIVDGLDYRGEAVISALLPVPDSPWLMVAKIDRAEALAVWQTNAALIVALLLGLVGTTAAGAGVLWQRGAKIHYLKLAQAETGRHASAEQHRLLFESMSQGVVYQDRDGHITDANPAAERILGLTLDQLRGLTSMDPRWRAVHEDGSDFPGEEHPSSVALRTGQPVHDVVMGVFNPAREGTTWINIHAAPQIHPGEEQPYQVYTTLEDITEREAAERALRESETYIKHILDNLPIGVSVNSVDPQVVFDYINDNFIRIYRTTRAALEQPDSFWEAVYEDPLFRKKLRKKVLEDCASGDPRRMRWDDIPVTRARDQTTYISAQNIPIMDNKLMVSVVWDTTHRVQAEEKVRKLNAELEKRVDVRTRQLKAAQEKLLRQERLATLGQLAGSVSHELRNPLGVISNAVYLLGQALPRDEKVREYLEIIQSETRTSERIITDLLDYSRVQMPERAALPTAGSVRDALARYPAPARVSVQISIPDGLPQLYVDPQHLSQVLGNLLTNAYQAMPAGGELKIGAAAVRRRRREVVKLDITDSGVGIPPKDLARLFEPLFTTKARGIGLGLATSRNLLEASGGWMEVSSRVGQGSTFSLFLPVVKKEEK